MTQHTPGPWTALQMGSDGWAIWCPNPRNPKFALMIASGLSEEQVWLLATAPELLEALHNITTTYRTFRNVPKDEQEWTSLDDAALEAGFAAIAKATGGQEKSGNWECPNCGADQPTRDINLPCSECGHQP